MARGIILLSNKLPTLREWPSGDVVIVSVSREHLNCISVMERRQEKIYDNKNALYRYVLAVRYKHVLCGNTKKRVMSSEKFQTFCLP